MNYRLTLSILFSLIVVFASSNKSKKDKNISENFDVDQECVALNNSAVDLYNNFLLGDSTVELQNVLNLVDQAILCDSNFYSAYYLKLSVLNSQKKYPELLKFLDKMINLYDSPLLQFNKGIAYERLNDKDSAVILFKQAANSYEQEVKKQPDNLNIIAEYIFFIAYTEGKDIAINELDKYILLHPDNNDLPILKNNIEEFDKDFYLQ